MLAAPQAHSVSSNTAAAPSASSRPSSRSGSKGRDEIEKSEPVDHDHDHPIGEKNGAAIMCDELNASVCDPHPLNHLQKSDSDEEDDEPEEVSASL